MENKATCFLGDFSNILAMTGMFSLEPMWPLLKGGVILVCLTHFWPMFPFHTPWKHQKIFGFEMSTLDTNGFRRFVLFPFIYTENKKDTNVIWKNTCILF